jgi:hypothetical protein
MRSRGLGLLSRVLVQLYFVQRVVAQECVE